MTALSFHKTVMLLAIAALFSATSSQAQTQEESLVYADAYGTQWRLVETFKQPNGGIQFYIHRVNSRQQTTHWVGVLHCRKRKMTHLWENKKTPSEFPVRVGGKWLKPTGHVAFNDPDNIVGKTVCAKHGKRLRG